MRDGYDLGIRRCMTYRLHARSSVGETSTYSALPAVPGVYVASTIDLSPLFNAGYSPIMAIAHQIFCPWGVHEFTCGR